MSLVENTVLAMAYASDEADPHAASPSAIAANDADVRFPLWFDENAEFSIPERLLKYTNYRLSNNAGWHATSKRRVINPSGSASMKGIIVDLVPFYLILGKAVKGESTLGAGINGVRQLASGTPVKVGLHVEQNGFTTPRVIDYGNCYCNELSVGVENKMLVATTRFVAGQYVAGNAFTSGISALRGSGSLFEGYATNDASNSVAWNSKALGSYLHDLSFTIRANVVPHEVQGSASIKLQNMREIEYSPVKARFLLDGSAANDLDDMEALIATTQVSDLVIKLCRSSTDYLQLSFNDCYLERWHATPVNTKKAEYVLIDAQWSPPIVNASWGNSPVQFIEKQVSQNDDATYEAVEDLT